MPERILGMDSNRGPSEVAFLIVRLLRAWTVCSVLRVQLLAAVSGQATSHHSPLVSIAMIESW